MNPKRFDIIKTYKDTLYSLQRNYFLKKKNQNDESNNHSEDDSVQQVDKADQSVNIQQLVNKLAPGSLYTLDGIKPLSNREAKVILVGKPEILVICEGDSFDAYALEDQQHNINSKLLSKHKLDGTISNIVHINGTKFLVSLEHAEKAVLYIIDKNIVREMASFSGHISSMTLANNNQLFVAINGNSIYPSHIIGLDITTSKHFWNHTLDSDDVKINLLSSKKSLVISNKQKRSIHIVKIEKNTCKDKEEKEDACYPGTSTTTDNSGGIIVADDTIITSYPDPLIPSRGCDIKFDWRVGDLHRIGNYILVMDTEKRHMAILDQRNMRNLHERSFSRNGALITVSSISKTLIVFDWGDNTWQYGNIDNILETFVGPLDHVSGEKETSKIFYGQKSFALSTAPTIGTLNVIAIPVIEPGQTFNDPDLVKFANYMQRESFDKAHRYYNEASYTKLGIDVSFFGHDIGPIGTPLILPNTIRSYFWPPFIPGGLSSTAVFSSIPYDITIDGTESLVLQIQPRERATETLSVPFCVLGLSTVHNTYPVVLDFTGTETAILEVVDNNGSVWTLNLTFPARTITINDDESDINTSLQQLETYLDTVLESAESSAGFTGGHRLFGPVEVRRIKDPNNDFGYLDINFRLLKVAENDIKGKVNVISQSGLGMIGFSVPIIGKFTIDTDIAKLESHIERAIRQSESDKGYDFNNALIKKAKATFDSSTKTLKIEILLSDTDGGPGASATRINQIGLELLGFDNAVTILGGESTFNDSNAVRHELKLFNDIYALVIDRVGDVQKANELLENNFNAILIAFVAQPPTTLSSTDIWNVTQPDVDGLRMFYKKETAKYPHENPTTSIQSNWFTSILGIALDSNGKPVSLDRRTATMCHELGHVLGFYDLYKAAGYRNNLSYLDEWSIMGSAKDFPHPCGYHKMNAEWITKIVDVELAESNNVESTEALLVPLEYWNDQIETAVKSVYTGLNYNKIKVAQLMKIHLGGDYFQFDLIEARQSGVEFSQNLPYQPAILVTNALDVTDDKRYITRDESGSPMHREDGYRRKVHQLNKGNDLQNPGDIFDLATAPELVAREITVNVVDVRDVLLSSGNTIKVFRVRVDRSNADFVDLYLAREESYQSSSIWIDWTGDNDIPKEDPDNHRRFPKGTPLGQGETVRYPPSNSDQKELHWIVVRVFNAGTVEAKDVKVEIKVCEPPGSGDDGNFRYLGKVIINNIPARSWSTIPSKWMIDEKTNSHLCIKAEITDWELPRDSISTAALASDDLELSNNWAQQNVFEFIPLSSSPYEPISFQYSVNNSGLFAETAFLEPEGIPYGMKLTVTPESAKIYPGKTAIFNCKLEIDQNIIDTGCKNDREFLLVAWRKTGEAQERWGACKYIIRPRKHVSITILNHFYQDIDGKQYHFHVSGTIEPNPGSDEVLVWITFEGQSSRWVKVKMPGGGYFAYDEKNAYASNTPIPKYVNHYVIYEGSTQYGPSKSDMIKDDFYAFYGNIVEG